MKGKILLQKPVLEKIISRDIRKDLSERLRLVEPKEISWTLNTTHLEDLKPLYKTIEEAKPQMIIYDPLGDLIGTSESLNDDKVARRAARHLQHINRKYNTFAIVSTHLKKRGEKLPEDIHELIHGSRYWLNQSSGHIVIMEAGTTLGKNRKKLYPKFKTQPERDRPIQLLFDRQTLWYEEVTDADAISEKAKIKPKDVADLLKRKYDGEAIPSILIEIIQDEFGYKTTQAKQLIKAALKQGYIIQDKQRAVYRVLKISPDRQEELELERDRKKE